MRLSIILIVAFRLWAIYWFLQGFNLILPAVVTLGRTLWEQPWTSVLLMLSFCFGFLFWFAAGPLARLVTRNCDTDLPIEKLTQRQLYSFAFLLVGLYFAASTFGMVLDWAHYLMVTQHSVLSPENSNGLYGAASTFVTFIVGLSLLFGSDRWARKLIEAQGLKPENE